MCIFAYGQTGSGKTFTMEGPPDNRGVNFRALDSMFALALERADEARYTISLSMLEIYNETIRDLLVEAPPGAGAPGDRGARLDIRQTPQGTAVPGLTEQVVTTMAEVHALFDVGNRNRAVGSHDMNAQSSRSHMILSLHVRSEAARAGGRASVVSKMHLIDLAGSERIAKTDASGDRLKEAQNINKSLSALGDVINALAGRKGSHVPYRNSKLTFLLQDSLSGDSKVMMFVNISPAVYNVSETLCSLGFAARCRAVELGQAKKQTSESPELAAARRQLAAMRTRLEAAGLSVGDDEGGGAGASSPARKPAASRTRTSLPPRPSPRG